MARIGLIKITMGFHSPENNNNNNNNNDDDDDDDNNNNRKPFWVQLHLVGKAEQQEGSQVSVVLKSVRLE